MTKRSDSEAVLMICGNVVSPLVIVSVVWGSSVKPKYDLRSYLSSLSACCLDWTGAGELPFVFCPGAIRDNSFNSASEKSEEKAKLNRSEKSY